MTKQYTHERVTYGFTPVGRTWRFEAPAKDGTKFTVFHKLATGAQTAHKIARVINGASKRGGMDNLARTNINKILVEANKPAVE